MPSIPRRIRAAAGVVVTPLALFVTFLGLWEWFIRARNIQPYLLPKPTAIWDAIQQRWEIGDLQKTLIATGKNAVISLALGTVAGVVMAVIASRFRVFREMVLPLSAALNAMPIIAVAPILNNAISSTSDTPRRLIVMIIVFFPVFINMMKGLAQVEPVHAELMASYAATGWAFTRKVRIPNALPFLFTAVRIAASASVIAAIVAEYFGGLQNGLGSRIASNAGQTKTPQAWAYVTAACGLGLTFFIVSLILERVATPWRNRRSST